MSVPTYEARVRRYYQDYLPETTAQLDDPNSYFKDLAEQIHAQVVQVSQRLAEDSTRPGEDYLTRLGTLNTVKAQAEELAFADLLYSTPPEQTDDEEDNETADQMPVMLRWQDDLILVTHRLSMDPHARDEITQWEAEHPHLVEMATWLQANHEDVSQEQLNEQLTALYDRADRTRPTP